jgi:hypothetical protein
VDEVGVDDVWTKASHLTSQRGYQERVDVRSGRHGTKRDVELAHCVGEAIRIARGGYEHANLHARCGQGREQRQQVPFGTPDAGCLLDVKYLHPTACRLAILIQRRLRRERPVCCR